MTVIISVPLCNKLFYGDKKLNAFIGYPWRESKWGCVWEHLQERDSVNRGHSSSPDDNHGFFNSFSYPAWISQSWHLFYSDHVSSPTQAELCVLITSLHFKFLSIRASRENGHGTPAAHAFSVNPKHNWCSASRNLQGQVCLGYFVFCVLLLWFCSVLRNV